MASSSSKKISVKCSEGMVLEVDETLVNVSPTMKRLIEEKCNESSIVITLPNISSETLSKIIEFIKLDLESDVTLNNVGVESADADCKASESLTSFNNLKLEFTKIDVDTLLHLITAAHYLKIEKIYDLGCEETARRIRGNTPEQIRQIFKIKNDFTPEEEEENKRLLLTPWFLK
ncbi:SKP1-like protein 1A [Cajanus cajan]|uniref:SKP1-like protein n=1 Tax=Cajanus cajan TaxID=3821 RepID=A0A151TQ80_CAJCA|nr:SKP1-like protein 1A [Cajanus cajan]KYP69181.1 SKP1-like protein 4 [Cajanus cajan]